MTENTETTETTQRIEREDLKRRTLKAEALLGGLMARLIGRSRMMLILGAKPLLDGNALWLPLGQRVDHRGVVYDLAVVLKRQVGYEPTTGREIPREILNFDVTHAPDGDPDHADTTHWPHAEQALLDYHREGPFWIPKEDL